MYGNNFSKIIFGNRLKSQRKEVGYRSQAELAARLLNITTPLNKLNSTDNDALESKRKTISIWETGKAMPSLEEFVILCDILECDPEYLLGSCPTPRKDTKSGMDITGLSKETIDKLIDMNSKLLFHEGRKKLKSLDILFECENFINALGQIADFSNQLEQLEALYASKNAALAKLKSIEEYKPDVSFLHHRSDKQQEIDLLEFQISNNFTFTLQEVRRKRRTEKNTTLRIPPLGE